MKDKHVRELLYLIKTVGLDKVTEQFKKTNEGIKETKSNVDRANKGVAGFAKNSTSSFAKQAQGLGGLVHVYATVAANVFALSSAFLVLKKSADLRILEEASTKLSQTTGINFHQVAENMKEISNGALTIADSMRQANLALASGLSTDQLEDITEVAVKAAAATGRSVEESVQRMVQAVVKGEPELVDEFGIILRVGKAVEDYALAHNKAAADLTTFERQQAIATQAIERGNKAYENIALEDVINPFQQLQVELIEISKLLISFVSGPLASFASFLKDNSALIFAGIALFVRYIARKAIPEIGGFYQNFLDKNKEAAKSFKKLAAEAKRSAAEIQDTYSSVTRSEASLVKAIRKADFSPDTEIAEAISGGRGKRAVTDAVVKEFTGRFKGEVDKIIQELDGSTNKFIETSLGIFSQAEAKAIIDILDKRELLNESQKRQLAEGAIAHSKNVHAKVRVAKAGLDERMANYKRFIAEGLAVGAESKFSALPELVAKQGDKAFAKQQSGTLKFVAKLSTGLGGVIGLVSTLASKFTAWGITFSVIASLLGPILNFLGIFNAEVSEGVDLLDEVIEKQEKISELTWDIIEFENTSLDTSDAIIKSLNMRLSALSMIKDSLKDIEDVANKTSEQGTISNWYNDTDEKAAEALAIEVANLRDLDIDFSDGISFDYKKITQDLQKVTITGIGLLGQSSVETARLVDVIEEIPITLKDSELGFASILEHIQGLEVGKERTEWIKAFATWLETARSNATGLTNQLKNLQNTFKASTTTIEENLTKRLAGLEGGGPFSEGLNQLLSMKKGLDAVKGNADEYDKAVSNLDVHLQELAMSGSIFSEMFQINNVEEFFNKIEELSEQQRAYFLSSSNLGKYQAQIDEQSLYAKQGNVAALKEQFRLQKLYNHEKTLQLRNEIAISKENLLGNISDRQKEIVQAEINRKTSQLNALLAKNSVEYSEQAKNIAVNNVNLKKQTLELEKQGEILKTRATIQDRIARDFSRGDGERQAAVEEKARLKILEIENKVAKARNELQTTSININELMQDQENNANAILEAEKKRAQLSGIIALQEYDITKVQQDAVKQKISLNEKANNLDINALKSRLEILKKVSDISEDIATDNRIAINERRTALEKSNSILKASFALEKALSEKRIANAKENLEILKAAGDKADPADVSKYQLQLDTEIALQLGLQAEARKRSLDFAEDLFEIQKKQTSLGNFFDKPQETMQLIRTEFALAAADFADKMVNPVDRLVGAIEDTIDNTVDAFVDTIVEGGDVLKATTQAITDSLNNAAINYTKDILKKLSRDLIVKLTGDENYGKSPEEILLGDQIKQADTANKLLQKIVDNTGNTSQVIMEGTDGKGLAGSIVGAFGNKLEAMPGSKEEFNKFDTADFDAITAEGIKLTTVAEQTMNHTNTWIDRLGESFTGFGSDLASMGSSVLNSVLGSLGGMGGGMSGGGGFASIATSLGSMFFAEKGGIFNALESVKGYKDGAITSGPELAMIGEGKNREAVVPLPDNRSIPVDLGDSKSGDSYNIRVNIQGVQGTEEGLRRSANQIGLQISRHLQKSNRRNG